MMNVVKKCPAVVAGAFLVLALTLVSCAPDMVRSETRPGFEQLSIAGKPVCWVEVVSDDLSRERGLMYRTSLEPDCGMLFVFEDEDFRSFWMKNVRIPLDIAYIKSDGTVTEILTMQVEEPGSTSYPRYPSKEKVRFALEMAEGWFKANGIQKGDRFDRLPKRSSSRG